GCEYLQGGNDAVAGAGSIQAPDVPGRLATDIGAAGHQALKHVAIADPGALEGQIIGLECQLQTQVAHLSADHRQGELALFVAIHGNGIKQLIAIDKPTGMIDHDAAIAIAIQCNANVGLLGHDCFAQSLGSGGATAVVDIQAIGLGANQTDLGAKLAKDLAGHVVGGAMRTVEHDGKSLESTIARQSERGLAKFDVAAIRAVDALCTAERMRINTYQRLLQHGLDFRLDLVGKLLSVQREKLDAVIAEWIM